MVPRMLKVLAHSLVALCATSAMAQTASDALIVKKQSEVALRKIVLSMLREMDSQNSRLDALEKNVGSVIERISDIEQEIADLDQAISKLSSQVLGGSPIAKSEPAIQSKPGQSRNVLATFQPNQQRASRLVSVDGTLYVESQVAAPTPVQMLASPCPHCVRCGSVQGVGGVNYTVYYQGCANRYVLAMNR